jgi:hypothetical protein
MVENTNSTIGSPKVVGLTYMVGIIPLNLRKSRNGQGRTTRARAPPPPPAGPGSGVAWRGEAGRRGVVVLIFSTH